jgi:hypothetical protein
VVSSESINLILLRQMPCQLIMKSNNNFMGPQFIWILINKI